MIKKYFLFLLTGIFSFNITSQTSAFLTNEEKAYMYHIVMKSPTLNRNLEYIFNYTGTYNTKDPDDYLYVEKEIINEPSLLSIELSEFQHQSNGIAAELAVKMALWTLYNELKKGVEEKNNEAISPIYQDFLDSLKVRVPKRLIQEKTSISKGLAKEDGKKVKSISLDKDVIKLLNPNLTYNLRKELIMKINGLDVSEERQLMDAIHETIKEYTERKSKDIFKMLGMKDDLQTNFLLAAGDGSGTAGLLGEKETDNVDDKGKPKGVGLFTYKTSILSSDNREELYPKKEPKETLLTIGKGEKTNLHLSMWGFNYSTQTAVVITKGEKTYLLYGSKHTGELSPDPAFNNKEKTYKNHIIELETVMIPEWEKEVFGEKGLEEKLKQYKIDKDELLLNIQKNEYEVSNLRIQRQKKNQKKIKRLGGTLTKQHERLSALNKKIEESEEEFEIGKTKLDEMKFRLRVMKENLGEYEQKFKQQDHLSYRFEDGTIFNLKTQDLIFEADNEPQEVYLQLLAIGSNPMSFYADEVQLNIAVSKINSSFTPVEHVELYLVDAFKPDRFRLDSLAFKKEADYLFTKMIQYVIDEDISLTFNLEGKGIGEKRATGIYPVNNVLESELKEYPGNTTLEKDSIKNTPQFKELRVTEGHIHFTKKDLTFDLASYTDPVKSNVFSRSSSLTSFNKQHPEINANHVLSGLRTYAVYEKLIQKMIKVSNLHLKNDKEKKEKYKKYFIHKLENTHVNVDNYRLSYDIYKKG